MDIQQICNLLTGEKKPVVTVFGDFTLDKYLHIDSALDELSVETGLPAYQTTHQTLYAGCAGTISNNLRALGVQVVCVGLVGDDGDGFELLRKLEGIGADTHLMVKTPLRQTCTYMKPMRLENGVEREISRIDIRNFTKTPAQLEDALIENLHLAAAHSDAVLVCDQFMEEDMAVVTTRVREALRQLALENQDLLCYVDSRGFIDRFREVMVKCNHKEIAAIFSQDPDAMTEETVAQLAGQLYARNHRSVIVTMGELGSIVYDGQAHKVPIFPVEGPIDICGAGDACNAGIVFALTMGASLVQAALVGNACSSITIQQIGTTGTATLPQLLDRLRG